MFRIADLPPRRGGPRSRWEQQGIERTQWFRRRASPWMMQDRSPICVGWALIGHGTRSGSSASGSLTVLPFRVSRASRFRLSSHRSGFEPAPPVSRDRHNEINPLSSHQHNSCTRSCPVPFQALHGPKWVHESNVLRSFGVGAAHDACSGRISLPQGKHPINPSGV
jgi:hypothetical protein